jgi:hypothetical protein
MHLPGFTAEAATTVRNGSFHIGARYQERSQAHTVSMASEPAHPPTVSGACINCLAAADAVLAGCTGACLYTGVFFPLCALGCLGATDITWSFVCHVGAPLGTPGEPCCPVQCPLSCCGTGETCAGKSPNFPYGNLCCSPGFTPCGGNCCDASETCLPNGSCCPTANACGGQNCCGAGETCLPNGSCCPTANVCGGKNCCGTGETCLPNGSCCPTGRAVCGGICCPNPLDVCDPVTNACTLACPGGAQSCEGTCCEAGQLCCLGEGKQLRQCVTPDPPQDGHQWCGRSAPTLIECFNCPPNQQCKSICSGILCSVNWYCQ